MTDTGQTHGQQFVEELKTGTFQKPAFQECRYEFDKGTEGLYLHEFVAYMSSCGCFLMDQRLKERNHVYTGE
jgi:hypothetical protein